MYKSLTGQELSDEQVRVIVGKLEAFLETMQEPSSHVFTRNYDGYVLKLTTRQSKLTSLERLFYDLVSYYETGYPQISRVNETAISSKLDVLPFLEALSYPDIGSADVERILSYYERYLAE